MMKNIFMKNIWIKLFLVLLMLFPVHFSCKDRNECLDLYFEPYYSIQNMYFHYVDKYWINQKTKQIMWDVVSQDYENTIYAADSMAMYFHAPDTALLFHSQNRIKSFTQEAFACDARRAGWAGTRDLVDKIYISSNYDFDETHKKNWDLSDIVDIFAYTTNGTNGKDKWISLSEYNNNSPYEAPKRFHLILKRKPTLSKTQQFVVTYYMQYTSGLPSKYFIMTTPVFQVR